MISMINKLICCILLLLDCVSFRGTSLTKFQLQECRGYMNLAAKIQTVALLKEQGLAAETLLLLKANTRKFLLTLKTSECTCKADQQKTIFLYFLLTSFPKENQTKPFSCRRNSSEENMQIKNFQFLCNSEQHT